MRLEYQRIVDEW